MHQAGVKLVDLCLVQIDCLFPVITGNFLQLANNNLPPTAKVMDTAVEVLLPLAAFRRQAESYSQVFLDGDWRIYWDGVNE